MMTAFGKKQLGLPLLGLNENRLLLNETRMNEFYDNAVSLNKLYVVAGAINDHDAFVRKVEDKIKLLPELSFKIFYFRIKQ